MALIGIQTVSTTAFERTKKKLYGFRQIAIRLLPKFKLAARACASNKTCLKFQNENVATMTFENTVNVLMNL